MIGRLRSRKVAAISALIVGAHALHVVFDFLRRQKYVLLGVPFDFWASSTSKTYMKRVQNP